MPGPWSRATTWMPMRLPRCASERTIAPLFAYSMMFRASSEIAVAITVRSLPVKPICDASSRPRCRASTMSVEEAMATTEAPRVVASWGQISRAMQGPRLWIPPQEGQALFEVQGRGHVPQGQPELDHGEGHFGLDPHDHGLGPPQTDHVGDRAQGPHGEGVHHVQDRDVDDGAPGPILADLLHQIVPQLEEVLVAQGRLDGADEVAALLQDRDAHLVRPAVRSRSLPS